MKTTETFSAKPRYEILDGLRGVAALMVLAFHLLETYSGGDHTKQILNHGYLAVDFFFVLSGFVIGYAYDDRWAKGMTAMQFFKRRLVRLHPMAVVGTLIGAALFYFQECAAWPAISQTSGWKVAGVALLCLTMVPLGKSFDVRGWGETNPLNGPAWSLQWEYFANALYALVVRRFRTWALAALVGLSAFLTLNLALNWDVFGNLAARAYAAHTVIGGWALTPDQLEVGLSRLLYPFFAGLLLSRLRWKVRMARGGFAMASAIVAAVLAAPYFAPAGMPWVNGLYEAAAILVVFPAVVALGAGAALGEGRPAAFCKWLGALSYPLYITHFPLVYMQMAWVQNHPRATASQHVFVGVSVFALAIAVAWAALKLYDEPVRARLQKFLFARTAQGKNEGVGRAGRGGVAGMLVLALTLVPAGVARARTCVGVVKAPDRVSVTARVTGELREQLVREGAAVAKGEALFRIEDTVYAANLRAAKGALAEIDAQLAFAEKEVVRYAAARTRNAVSESDHDRAVQDCARLRARREKALADVALAENDVAYTTVRAPIAGIVGEVAIKPGNVVSPDSGRLVEIVAYDPALVKFSLAETDYFRVFDGGTAKTNVAFSVTRADGIEAEGRAAVDFAEPQVDPATDTVMVQLRVPNRGRRLLPGGYVKVRVEE